MFDNLNENDKKNLSLSGSDLTKKSAPPENVATSNTKPGVEDIFSDSKPEKEKEPARENNNKSANDFNNDLGINSLEIEQQNKRKLMVLMLMFLGLVGIGWGTYFAFGKVMKKIANIDNVKKEENTFISEDEKKIIPENKIEEKVVEKEEVMDDTVTDLNQDIQTGDEQLIEEKTEIIDTDKDGLADTEEIELGMNINSVDTDSDGLFDREEVKIYKTDPLNPDTDSDGFSDGDEVKSGYNPKGSGKILNINRGQN